MSQPPLSARVYNFLLSNGVACLRDVYEALGENPHCVDDRLRRLWIKGLILRTREPTFEFETCHRGRAGCVGHSKLREHGVDKKVTVQKICRVCKDEKDVRVVLDEI